MYRLGNSISQVPEPPLNDAGDPEWQCEIAKALSGSFQEWPWHCQNKMLQDLSVGLADLYGYSQKQENPEKVLVDSPLPTDLGPMPPSEITLVYARTSTAKKDDKKPKAIPPINLPEEYVEIKIPPLDMTEILGMVDASVSQTKEPITVRYMNPKYVKDFLKAHDEAKKRLRKDDCAKLFGKSKEDLMRMLENTEYRVLTLSGGGPRYDPETGAITVTGAQTNSPTSVFINDKGPFFNNQMFVPGKSGIQTLDFKSGLRGAEFGALLLLHELAHQAGIFGPDAGNQKLNREYTRRVQKACF